MTAMHRTNRPSWLTALLMSATLALAIVPSVAAAKPEPYSCSLSPGDTTLSWRGDRDTVSIGIDWLNADLIEVGHLTVIITNGKPEESVPTPAGATQVVLTYNDSLGGVVTVVDACV
jgi:hypothetical protein